ncbi:MAG: extracellular solute-binding protein [Oscillospiraceae bacterium]|nr:extracellular solute-binding protein [Oscillospiraceae bacterium]
MKSRIWVLLLSIAILTSCLAGCGNSEAPASAPEPAEASQESAAEAPAQELEAPAEPQENEPAEALEAEPEESEEEAPAEPEFTISYPLEDGGTFDVLYAKPTILEATVMNGVDYDFSEVYPDMIEATGVELIWQSVSEQAWETQISLIIAAGDYPDACADRINYTTGNIGLIQDEVMLDLADMIPEHMPNYYALLQKDKAFADCVYNSDGTLTQISSRGSTFINNGLNIRQDWLDELGFDTPTTVDELTDFLLACKDKYDLTNPYLVLADLNIGLNRAFNVKAEGDRMGYQLAEEGSDEIVWSGTTQNFRDYVEFLRNWYEIGIFNDDYLNISNQNGNVQSTYMAGNTAAWNSDCAALLDDSVDGVPVPDLKIYNDETTNISGITDQEKVAQTGHMMVFNSCERPETFLEFLDYFFTDEGNLLANWGVVDKTFVYDESGKPTYSDAVWADTDCFFFLLRSAKYGLYWAPCDFDVNLMIADYTPEQYDAVDMWVATRGSYLCYPPNFQLSTEDRDIVNQYENDCSTYFWEHVYKVIAGQETMEDFDTAVQTALDMGMTEIVDAYNRSYQDYLAQNG